jgi:apolipoprotein D and lipocalin family protein
MLMRPTAALAAAALLASGPVAMAAQAALVTVTRIDPATMMGRWYEIARLPNKTQSGCQAGASDWSRAADGFSVIQSCHRGSPDGPLAEWKAKAKVADPVTNAKFKMSFFGGLISQEYWVIDRREEQGWLILATQDGRYLWLMSQQPVLPAAARALAVTRIRALGFDPARLEWPQPSRG